MERAKAFQIKKGKNSKSIGIFYPETKLIIFEEFLDYKRDNRVCESGINSGNTESTGFDKFYDYHGVTKFFAVFPGFCTYGRRFYYGKNKWVAWASRALTSKEYQLRYAC
ncbi:MAG: hypothetical protein L6R40_007006 [Gallowayella cf. fulva]|nr:MAG: hypothetical protein L6R40_007006 [Xanthomendoza cf. fulva]